MSYYCTVCIENNIREATLAHRESYQLSDEMI